ncbi:MAG: HAMP domain-containing protein [Gemmatimonadaceae bacterium]|nr:HAMP domain-containing protein [Gemmatimonadaceae bacterium]
MKLAHRLLLGAVGVVGAMVLLIIVSVDRQLAVRLTAETTERLTTEARLVAGQWTPGVDPDALAGRLGRESAHRITLIDSTGRVIGDSEFDPPELGQLENHAGRPEVMQARADGVGSSRRRSPSAGNEELYVAVRAPLGVARVSLATTSLDAIVSSARRDVAVSGLIALLVAILLSWLFARSVSQPVVELASVARGLAAGDFSQRPARAAPGEVGDLAVAVSRLAEQLSARVEALRAEETLVRELAESLNEGFLAVDARPQIVRVNETARQLLGIRAPLPFGVEQLPRDRAFRDALAAALAGQTVRDVEVTLDGRILNITARPLEPRGAVLALLDVTRLRRLESVRRDFVANVSHEMKTPLTVIRGFAETLADDDPPADTRRQFAQSIAAHTRRMQRLVDDLLDLSRIESGGWVPAPQAVDLAAVLGDDISAARAVADRKGIRLDVSLDETARVAFADPTALRQIVGNLVENALRHTTRGSVTLRTTRDDAGVTVSVSDTGCGIAAEHLPRIFERFYRVDPARSREEGGTGLGLSIVKHLADAHGGRVQAESTLGEGTTIRVWFPDGRDAA